MYSFQNSKWQPYWIFMIAAIERHFYLSSAIAITNTGASLTAEE